MKVYKGTDRDIKCRNYQFTPGVPAEETTAKLCRSGFHACEAPLDVMRYYHPKDGARYFEAELEEVSPERHSDDTKVCGRRITLGIELGLPGLIKAQAEYVKAHTTTEHTDPKQATAGNYGAATAGNYGAATAGNYGAATAGDSGAATAGDSGVATSRGSSASGNNGLSVARAWGGHARVKGGLGAILVIANENDDGSIKNWKAVVVDGEKVKADTWYRLTGNNRLVEDN